MKKNLLFLTAILFALNAFAQSNNKKISCQTVVRNSANQRVYDADLTVIVGIANSDGGTAVYTVNCFQKLYRKIKFYHPLQCIDKKCMFAVQNNT